MPFIATAVVKALAKFPIINASLIDGAIHYHQNINLGIAVALPWGLICAGGQAVRGTQLPGPGPRHRRPGRGAPAPKSSCPTRWRDPPSPSPTPASFGDEFSTPIINQPDSAILAISGLKKEAVVLTDDEGNDTIAIRSTEHFCLGFDHRTIDGADACKFMAEFKKTLEGWTDSIG